MRRTTAISIALFLLLAGCTTSTPPTRTADEAALVSTVERDPENGSVTVLGPKLRGHDRGSRVDYRATLVGRRIERDGKRIDAFQLVAAASHRGRWHVYEVATAPGGALLKVVEVDRDVWCSGWNTCRYSETVGATIPRAYLESQRAGGLSVTFDGRKGDLVVDVPGHVLDGFLRRFDAEADMSSRAATERDSG